MANGRTEIDREGKTGINLEWLVSLNKYVNLQRELLQLAIFIDLSSYYFN